MAVAKKRMVYLDLLKVIAIFLVIYNHSHQYMNDTNSLVKSLHYLTYDMCKVAVPLFIMTTGAIFLGRQTSYSEIFRKRIFRVIIPLLVVLGISIFLYGGDLKGILLSPFVIYTIPEYPYWVWYLYMLIGLYMVTPFLQRMIKNFKEKDYMVFFALFLFLPSVLEMFPYITNIVFGEPYKFVESFSLCTFSICIGYYVLGYYLNNKVITSKMVKISSIVYVLFVILGTVYLYLGINKFSLTFDTLISYQSFLICIPSLCVFVIFKYFIGDRLKNKHINNTICNLSNLVFGIYLFHVFITRTLYDMNFIQITFDINTCLGVLILDIICFVITAFIVYLLRLIPVFKKFL